MDIIGVPEWDPFVKDTIDRSGHHRDYNGRVMSVHANEAIY